MTVQPGVRLGPYEVVERLGAGGMGEVFRARDTRLGRSVALKVLPAAYAEDLDLRARLEREARAISQLNHPHICTLYDVGVHDGVPYLVLELLEGETLAHRLGRAAMAPADVLRYGTQIAQALARAHRAGIVHRDLKPGNVMITPSGAKLLDFGLARTTGPERVLEDGSSAHGMLVGTVPYMAPEQLARQKADERSDIYALGAVLYEMATGYRAFDGRRTPAPAGPSPSSSQLTAAGERPPEPAAVTRQVLEPPALHHLVARCLVPDAAARWQSAHDVAQQLAFLASGGDAAALPSGHGRAVAWPVLAAAFVCIAAGAAWAGRATSATTGRPAAYRFVVPLRGENLFLGGLGGLSPDGKRLAIVGRRDETRTAGEIFVHSFDSFGFHPVAGTEGSLFDAWSPDGQQILFSRENRLYRVPWRGGSAEVVAEITPDVWKNMLTCAGCTGWAPGGDILLGYLKGTLAHLAPGARSFASVPAPDLAPGDVGLLYPTFLPDGRTFLATSYNEAAAGDPHGGRAAAGRAPSLYAGRLGEGIVKSLGPVHSKVRYSRGHLFHVREGTLLATPFDPDTLVLGASSHVVAQDVFQLPAGGAGFDAAGDTIAYRPTPRADQIWLFEPNGDRARAIGPTMPLASGNFDVRPDGAEIAVFAGLPERNHPRDLWAFGIQRPTQVRLTDAPGIEVSPLYAPDGRDLFYATGHTTQDIYRKTLGMNDPAVIVLAGPRDEFPVSISPDGRHLVYLEARVDEGTGADLFVLPLGGGTPRVLVATRGTEMEASFSPDGRWIAYASDISGRFEVYAQPFPGPGHTIQVTTAGGRNPRWSADGRHVYFVHDDHEVHITDFTEGRAGDARRMFRVREHIKDLAGVLRDGRLVLALSDPRLLLDAPVHVITGWTPEATAP